MIDIVKIRQLVNDGILKFEIKNSFVYLKNLKTEEQVVVGKFEEKTEECFSVSKDGFVVTKKLYKFNAMEGPTTDEEEYEDE